VDRDNQPDSAAHLEEKPGRTKVLLLGDVHWGLAWGLILVLVGAALLLDHMGITPVQNLYRLWPLLLVLFGVMNISTHSARGFGFLLIVLGVLLQLNIFEIIHLTGRDFWPLVIIGIGVLLIWGSVESWALGGRKPRKPKVDWTKPGAAEEFRRQLEETYKDPNWLSAVAVFSGCERRYNGQHLQGGKVVSIFGGVELDFRDADMDEEAVLELNCIFGAVEIRVPNNWTVHSRSLPVFGGFEDKSGRQKVEGVAGSNKRRTLVITGTVVFGGVEITN